MNRRLARILIAVVLAGMLLSVMAAGCGGDCSVMCCKQVLILGRITSQCNAFKSNDCSCPGDYVFQYTIVDRRTVEP